MNDDDQFIARITARVSMHEFLLEQLAARLAMQTNEPLAAWAEFGSAFVTKMSQPWTANVPTPEQQDWVDLQARLGVELAQNFVQKVARRIEQGEQ